MADSKISALPSASTPLAGTEVAPIVQSGTTKKVAVSDLTAGRTVAASVLQLSSSGEIVKLTTSGDVTGAGTDYLRFYDSGGAKGYVGYAGTAAQFDINSGASCNLNLNAVNGTLMLQTANASRVTITNSNTTINTGNLVIDTAGKGVTFTSGVSFVSTLNNATVGTTATTCSATATSGGGVVYISGYNASGGNRFVALIGYRDTVVTSIYTSNNTGLTINFTATSNVLQIATTSGSVVCSSVSFTF